MKLLKNKTTVILLSITGILAVLTSAALVFYLNNPAKQIELPEFTEKTIQDIKSWKEANQLLDEQVVFEYVYDDENEKDTVLSQSPEAGTKLKDKDYSIFTIDEQQELSGVNLANQNDSVLGKLFGYIFNG